MLHLITFGVMDPKNPPKILDRQKSKNDNGNTASQTMATACQSRAAKIFHRSLTRQFLWTSHRNHMNHGGGGGLVSMTSMPGPRTPTQIGFRASETTQHVLRLLESASSPYQDTVQGIWHDNGLIFRKENVSNGSNGSKWVCQKPNGSPTQSQSSMLLGGEYLLSINLSDERTGLIRIQSEATGKQSFYSILRLDNQPPDASYYNGWKIVRAVCQVADDVNDNGGIASSNMNMGESYSEIEKALQTYLSIEHGGGQNDSDRARSLFAEEASLLSVGIDSPPEDGSPVDTSPWSEVVGNLLEIPLQTYIDGVYEQSPHDVTSRQYDSILSIEILPCRSVAAATILVGNGACTKIFCDHLLLGRYDGIDGTAKENWKVLSKTFSVRNWPKG